MVVVVEGLHPAVAGLDGEAAGDALGREQLVPVWGETKNCAHDNNKNNKNNKADLGPSALTVLAVGQAVLQVEGGVGEDLPAVGADEALGVERAVHGLQSVLKRKKILFLTNI